MKAFCDNARINKRIHTDEDGNKRYGVELTSLESGKGVFLEVQNEDRADVLEHVLKYSSGVFKVHFL